MKRLLLDTHVFLWWLSGDPSLGTNAKEAIREGSNEVYISAATTWEISIKQAMGKMKAPSDIDSIIEEERFLRLPISLYHGQMADQLPHHHKDPFDRMLIAQSQAEGLTIVTTDQMFLKYGVQVLAGYL